MSIFQKKIKKRVIIYRKIFANKKKDLSLHRFWKVFFLKFRFSNFFHVYLFFLYKIKIWAFQIRESHN